MPKQEEQTQPNDPTSAEAQVQEAAAAPPAEVDPDIIQPDPEPVAPLRRSKLLAELVELEAERAVLKAAPKKYWEEGPQGEAPKYQGREFARIKKRIAEIKAILGL